jgi:NADH-quinone oxidoreductase subunit D
MKEKLNEDGSELSILNLGPTHPATHGIFQNILATGNVFRGRTNNWTYTALLKNCRKSSFYQITPLTDRMNYCSSPINNMGWWMTLEKLLNIEVPKRAQYLRVIVMELARITDHLICNSILGVDTGAYTGFFYMFSI